MSNEEEDECDCCGVERPCPLEEYAKICEFRPTADCVNALPENLRKYIHDLETRCDPAGDVAEIILTRDLMANVGLENTELRDDIRKSGNEVERLRVLCVKYAEKFEVITSSDGSGHADIGRALRREL